MSVNKPQSRLWARLFAAAALLISHIMCAFTAYNYTALQYAALYEGGSAPPSAAFAMAAPFLAAIILCLTAALLLRRRGRRA